MYKNTNYQERRDTGARVESDCWQCRQTRQELREMRERLYDLEEGKDTFKQISIGRADVIAAAIEIITGVTGGRSLDLIRLAKSIREAFGELPEMLE